MMPQLILSALSLGVCLFSAKAQADNPLESTSLEPVGPVVAVLSDGRQCSGFVDSSSTPDVLVLRTESPHVVLRTIISRSKILSVTLSGQPLPVEPFFDSLDALSSPGRKSAFAADQAVAEQLSALQHEILGNAEPVPRRVMIVTSEQDRNSSAGGESAIAAFDRPQALQLMTRPANWDQDGAVDGLIAAVRVDNRFGDPIAVDGTLELKLTGTSHAVGGQAQSGNTFFEFPVLERWFVRVRRSDFVGEFATLRLEFRRFRPDLDINVIPAGLLSAKLVVPGSGTFAVTEELTFLRPYSPVRDIHQMFRGSRNLPGELAR